MCQWVSKIASEFKNKSLSLYWIVLAHPFYSMIVMEIKVWINLNDLKIFVNSLPST